MLIVSAKGYYYDGEVDILGRRHGYGIAVSDDGARYEGGWRHGRMHGRGKLIWPEGGWCYEGEFRSDKRHGQGIKIKTSSMVYARLRIQRRSNFIIIKIAFVTISFICHFGSPFLIEFHLFSIKWNLLDRIYILFFCFEDLRAMGSVERLETL